MKIKHIYSSEKTDLSEHDTHDVRYLKNKDFTIYFECKTCNKVIMGEKKI